MKKNSKQAPNKPSMTKIGRFKKLLKEDKKFFALFATLFSLVLVIGSTFAWSSYSSWVKNHMQTETGTVDVKVVEEFKQDDILEPDKQIQKSVKVKNNSDKKAIIRVKLEESTATFKVDEATGMLVKKEKGPETEVNRDITSTWKEGNVYQSQLNNKEYYVLDHIVKDKTFDYSQPVTRDDKLKIFDIVFSGAVSSSTNPGAASPYWVYDDGYFYYSKVLDAQDITKETLMENITVSGDNQKNSQKNQLYNLDVTAIGMSPTSKALEEWSVSPSIKAMFEEDSSFEK